MAYWHNWLNAQDSVKLSSTVKGVIRQTIGKWFFPAPYELAAAAMNDMTQLGQWDRELIESFPDSANVTDGINNHLLNVNIRRFMDNLKETIGEHASGEFKTWCLKFNWHSGPYKGPNYQL